MDCCRTTRDDAVKETATGTLIPDWPRAPAGRAWYLVFLLFWAYLLSFLDRQIIALMVGAIQRDLNIGDFQFSLLHGVGFGLFYAVFGIPIALAADRLHRTRIIAAGMLVWSGMTIYCGLAENYTQLFIGRIGVGIGEAALAPAAYSLLSDVFDKRRLPTAVAVFSLGSTVGSGLALAMGGGLLDALSRADLSRWPWLSGFAEWQLAFFVAGLPGIFFAFLILIFPEPERHGFLSTRINDTGKQLRHTFRFVLNRPKLYLGLFSAIGAMTALSSGIIVWFPAYLIRIQKLSVEQAGLTFGLLFALFASGGAIFGGWLVSRLYARLGQAAYMVAMLVAICGALLSFPWLGLSQSLLPALICVAAGFFFTQSLAGVSVTAIQVVTPNEMRAQVSALFLLFVNLLGYGAGAPLIAGLTDFVYGSPQALASAMSVSALLLAPIALVCLLLARRSYTAADTYVA